MPFNMNLINLRRITSPKIKLEKLKGDLIEHRDEDHMYVIDCDHFIEIIDDLLSAVNYINNEPTKPSDFLSLLAERKHGHQK